VLVHGVILLICASQELALVPAKINLLIVNMVLAVNYVVLTLVLPQALVLHAIVLPRIIQNALLNMFKVLKHFAHIVVTMNVKILRILAKLARTCLINSLV